MESLKLLWIKTAMLLSLCKVLNLESVIRVDGKVLARSNDQINPNLPTGQIEVRAVTVEILSTAAELHCQSPRQQNIQKKLDSVIDFSIFAERNYTRTLSFAAM